MATYNNKHWLLSHIRNSFISTDDTGMCETIMLSDDLPSKCIELCKMRRDFLGTATRNSNRPADDYEWYPGLDQSDDEDGDPLSQSYDVQMDQDYGLRKHTLTAQKFEKMELAKKRAAKIKSIKCDDNFILDEAEANELFTRNEHYATEQSTAKGVDGETVDSSIGDDRKSLLTQKLEEMRRRPMNKFQQYARFDGNQMMVATKSFKIFLTMLATEQQNYPLDVCVIATAKIQEFIGLICYKCSLAHSDAPLLSVQNYGLYITEGDGEIDDFPPLDLREPCSKFRFSHLALVERKSDGASSRFDRPLSLHPDVETASNLNNPETLSHASNNPQDLERMKGHTIMMEAPLYRSYRVKIFTKGLFKTDIQLGISGEKLEIDPVQPQNSKFWSRQKPISHNMDLVVWCEIEETTRSRCIVRIVYSTAAAAATNNDEMMLKHQLQQQQQHYGNSSFRHYDFVTNPVTAAEIVEKINNIIEVRSSASRREYLARYPTATKKKKITFSFK